MNASNGSEQTQPTLNVGSIYDRRQNNRWRHGKEMGLLVINQRLFWSFFQRGSLLLAHRMILGGSGKAVSKGNRTTVCTKNSDSDVVVMQSTEESM
jgi:hypothetical protein